VGGKNHADETQPERRLMAMCGRPRLGKGCYDGDASWSGAAIYSACLHDTMITGPNAIRGSGPNYTHELGGSLAKTGFPDPRCSTGLALPHVHPSQLVTRGEYQMECVYRLFSRKTVI